MCLMVDHQAGDRKSDESDVQAAGLAPAGPWGVRPPACGRQQEFDLLYWGLLALMPSSGYLPGASSGSQTRFAGGKEVENPHAVSYSRARK